MQHVLIIEDSRTTAKLMAHAVEANLGFPCDIAPNKAKAKLLLREHSYFVVLCDLNLPDAQSGEAVDLVLEHDVACIVVSASLNEETRRRVLKQPIADYVVKRGPDDLQYLLRLIKRIYNNATTKALVVDDSSTYREQVHLLLAKQRLQVFEAEDGKQALHVLEKNPDIRLVLTDYQMPVMDGYELTGEIRKRYSPEDLAIIATTLADGELAPLFLKSGANDFISKTSPFEELLCRINMNLDMLDLIHQNKELAEKDALTGLCNRGVLHRKGTDIFMEAQQSGGHMKAAMLDIDHFKHVNDTYGHLCGDMALRQVGEILSHRFPAPCSVYRYGGEEFCILFPGEEKPAAIATRLETFRKEVESTPVVCNGEKFPLTISIGLFTQEAESLEALLNVTDTLLYEAKEGGRNRLVCA